MITSLLLTILNDLVGVVISPFTYLPDASLPDSLTQGYANVQGFISTVNPIFPIDTLLICISFIVGIELAIFAYKAIMWLIKKIPMIS